MMQYETVRYPALLIGLFALCAPIASSQETRHAQETRHVVMDGTATERDGSVHELVFHSRVPAHVARALAGEEQDSSLRWTPFELAISMPSSGSRWTATAAEYQPPHRYGFQRWSGDSIRFEWAPDPRKGPMECQLSRPARPGAGAGEGRFTGVCRDPRYPDHVLLELTLEGPRFEPPAIDWPSPPGHRRDAPLLIRWTSDLEAVWRAAGNSNAEPVAFYRPRARDGFLSVGHMAQGNHEEPRGRLLVVKENPDWSGRRYDRRDSGRNDSARQDLLAPPVDYVRLWWNRGSSPDRSWSIWQPVGALGYRCLGSVVHPGTSDPPDRDEVVCLREDLLTTGRAGEQIWDFPSRTGFLDVSLFQSQADNGHPLGTFLTLQRSGRYGKPVARWVPRYGAVSEDEARGPTPRPRRRFVDRGDGTVLDQKTGLVWLQRTDCVSERSAATAARSVRSLRHGTCGLSDGSRSCDWRLPTLEEWRETQGDAERRGCSYPALTDMSGDCLSRGEAPFSGDVLSARRSIKGQTSGVCWLSSRGRSGYPQVMMPGRGGWSSDYDPEGEGCVWAVRSSPR